MQNFRGLKICVNLRFKKSKPYVSLPLCSKTKHPCLVHFFSNEIII